MHNEFYIENVSDLATQKHVNSLRTALLQDYQNVVKIFNLNPEE